MPFDNYDDYPPDPLEDWYNLVDSEPEMVSEVLEVVHRNAKEIVALSCLDPAINKLARDIVADIDDMFETEQTPQQMGWVGSDGLP